jgi:hypothetical protein
MGTTTADLQRWFDRAKASGATHLIVVVDTFSHEDYPVPVMKGLSVRDKLKEYTDGKHSMQRIVEVYNLSKQLVKRMST